jgi:hypothetical protein
LMTARAAKGEAAETEREPTYVVPMAGLGLIAAVPETGAGRPPVATDMAPGGLKGGA